MSCNWVGAGMRRDWRRALCICVVALGGSIPGGAIAQEVVIEGRIVSARDRTPVADVAVRVEPGARAATTDAGGRYRIPRLPEGKHGVIAQRLGYRTERKFIELSAGLITVDFMLQEEATLVAPVIVSATRELQRRADASATIDVLDGSEVRRTRAAHPSGIMNRLPGVHVSQLSGEGHSMAIRQPITTKPMYLFLEDGVPTRATGFFNHNALYEVNIPQAGGIEVLKGPGTALYGSDAIGGVVNVLTRPPPGTPEIETAVEVGAFGYGRVLASGGLTNGRHGLRADLNVTRSENWKDEAPFRRQSGTVRWDIHRLSGWTARTVLAGSNISQFDVPSLTAAQFDSNITLNRAPIAYRDAQALRVSSAIERERNATLWSITPFARYNVMALLPSWQLSFDPQTWDTGNTSVGVLAKYRRDIGPWRSRIVLGADVDWSPGSFTAKRAVTTQSGGRWTSYTEGETHYDYDVTYRAASPYAHLEFSPAARIRIDAGLRYDLSGYDYRTHLAPLDTGAHRRPANTERSYGHLSPKVGAVFVFTPALTAFASYRHGFRAPSQSQLFQQNAAANTVDLDPVQADSYELGFRGEAGNRVAYQLSGYDMRVRHDIITFRRSQFERVATNAGQTRHRGLEASLTLVPLQTVRLDASYSVSRQTYVEWSPGTGVHFTGNRIEQAPSTLSNLFVTWTPGLLRGGRIAAEWSTTGRYAMDPENTRYYTGYELVNLHGSAAMNARTEFFVRVTNVLYTKFAEIATYNPFQGEQYTPGSPRAVYAGIQLGWQR